MQGCRFVIHFWKQAATDGNLDIGSRIWLWFRAKSTTLLPGKEKNGDFLEALLPKPQEKYEKTSEVFVKTNIPRWCFQIFFIFTPIPGKMIQSDSVFFLSKSQVFPPDLDASKLGDWCWSTLLACCFNLGLSHCTYGVRGFGPSLALCTEETLQQKKWTGTSGQSGAHWSSSFRNGSLVMLRSCVVSFLCIFWDVHERSSSEGNTTDGDVYSGFSARSLSAHGNDASSSRRSGTFGSGADSNGRDRYGRSLPGIHGGSAIHQNSMDHFLAISFLIGRYISLCLCSGHGLYVFALYLFWTSICSFSQHALRSHCICVHVAPNPIFGTF